MKKKTKIRGQSFLNKILFSIGISVVLTYLIGAILTLNTVDQSISNLTKSELEAKSKQAAFQIEGSFIKYMEMAKQMSLNSQFEQLCYETTPARFITTTGGYPEAFKTMVGIEKEDPDHIMCSWIVDFETNNITDSDGWIGDESYNASTRPWYNILLQEKDVILTDPYVDTTTNLTVISAIAPIFKYGTQEIIGAVGIDFNIESINSMLKEYKFGKTGFFILASKNGQIIYHPNEKYTNISINDTKMSKNIMEAILKGNTGLITFDNEGNKNIGYISAIGNTGWTISSGLPLPEFNNIYNSVKNKISIIFGIALILVTLIIISVTLKVLKPIKHLTIAANRLALGDINVDVLVNAETREIGELIESFSSMADNIKERSIIAEKIASGDLTVTIEPKSDSDVLAISMSKVVSSLQSLVEEAQMLTQAAVDGELSTRGDVDKFHGGYKQIITGINDTLDAISTPLGVAKSFIVGLANGTQSELISDVEQYKGYYGDLIKNLNSVSASLMNMLAEIAGLTEAAMKGNLSHRADVSKLNGGYITLVQGVNETMDAVMEPLKMTAGYIDRIGKGDIPEKIVETYYGDFDEIKNSINSCIDGLGGLQEGYDVMYRMSLNDYSIKVEGTYLGIFEEIKKAINLINYRMNRVIQILTNVSAGDLSDLQNIIDGGKRSEGDTLVPALIAMIESIKALVDETDLLALSAVEGKLSTRGEESKFKGQYARVIQGINEILDAIAAPIEDTSTTLQEMARGNLSARASKDYIGEFAVIKDAINSLGETQKGYIEELTEILEQMAEKDFTGGIAREYLGDYKKLKDSINFIEDQLNDVLSEINVSADQVEAGASQVASTSQSLSQGASEQACSVEEISATIAEVAEQTKQNATNANRANELSTKAKMNAEKGKEDMEEMLNAMKDINESSKNISKVVKVIDDIAFQTNILALNAAVEAARAGQHGKGFSVVAEEVRNLAARSAAAAKETTVMIENSIQKVEEGYAIANKTANALHKIVGGVTDAVETVEKISEASVQQATFIAQIDTGISQISKITQANTATAEESAAASEEMAGQAQMLKNMIRDFQIKGVECTSSFNLMAPKEQNEREIDLFLENSEDKYEL
jgi:methyl-accepting chemotaxis protein